LSKKLTFLRNDFHHPQAQPQYIIPILQSTFFRNEDEDTGMIKNKNKLIKTGREQLGKGTSDDNPEYLTLQDWEI